MKIADVFNEKSKEYYRQENASEYAYITAGKQTNLKLINCLFNYKFILIFIDEYTSEEVIDMEKKILTFLDFNCFSPTVLHFCELYLRVIDVPEEVKVL